MTARVRVPCCVAAMVALAHPPALSAQPPDDPAARRVDLLSWGAGAFVVRLEVPASNDLIRAAIDGDPRTVSIGIPRREPLPARFVVELPALTTFDTFAVPVIDEFGSARGRHVRTIVVEGSTDGPDAGFEPLVTLTLQLGQTQPQTFAVPQPRAVRWVRVQFTDRLIEAPSDTDPHMFSELIGYGTQDPIDVPENRFTGRWRHRRRGINDAPGVNTIELFQDGLTIRGCEVLGGQMATISGTIVDGLAQLTYDAVGAPEPVPALVTVTAEGDLTGARFSRSFSPFWASADPDAAPVCDEPEEENDPIVATLEAGLAAIIHGINFNIDSDVPRPDATPALERLLAALEATGTLAVVIEGHTDSDGTEDHNLDLSNRRAAAVVTWLTERGIDAARLTPAGLGESRPIADNVSAAGRALNRRVEVRARE